MKRIAKDYYKANTRMKVVPFLELSLLGPAIFALLAVFFVHVLVLPDESQAAAHRSMLAAAMPLQNAERSLFCIGQRLHYLWTRKAVSTSIARPRINSNNNK